MQVFSTSRYLFERDSDFLVQEIAIILWMFGVVCHWKQNQPRSSNFLCVWGSNSYNLLLWGDKFIERSIFLTESAADFQKTAGSAMWHKKKKNNNKDGLEPKRMCQILWNLAYVFIVVKKVDSNSWISWLCPMSIPKGPFSWHPCKIRKFPRVRGGVSS